MIFYQWLTLQNPNTLLNLMISGINHLLDCSVCSSWDLTSKHSQTSLSGHKLNTGLPTNAGHVRINLPQRKNRKHADALLWLTWLAFMSTCVNDKHAFQFLTFALYCQVQVAWSRSSSSATMRCARQTCQIWVSTSNCGGVGVWLNTLSLRWQPWIRWSWHRRKQNSWSPWDTVLIGKTVFLAGLNMPS